MKNRLINAVIDNKDIITYINLDDNNCYKGWTHDFKLSLPNGELMKLELKDDSNLFLLFVLASSWSKTGQWENAVYFVTYLKQSGKGEKKFWKDDINIKSEIKNRKINAVQIVETCKGINPRKKVSFRKDYYSSIRILSNNWEQIVNSLKLSEENNDYLIFIKYISNIEGLGAGKNKMRIKIPLILRELRCQNIYKNIPGKYCCVPDERVKNASKELGIELPTINSISNLLKASEIIYKNFGDLYDIPLFAYEDLKDKLII